MKKIKLLLAFIGLSLVVTSCKNKYEKSTDGAISIMWKNKVPIADTFKSVVPQVLTDFRKFCGVPTYPTLTITDTVYPSINVNGKASMYGAKSVHANIELNPTGFTLDWYSAWEFRNTMVHEIWHTLRPEERTEVTPFKLDSTLTVVAYRGVTPIFTPKGYHNSYIEEGVADLVSSLIYPDYIPKTVMYRNVASLMKTIMTAKWVTLDNLITAETTNDLPLLVGLIVKKPKDKVSPDDIVFVINIFTETYNNGDPDGPFQKIAERRGEKGMYQLSH